MPSAASRMVNKAAAELVSSSLTLTPPGPRARRPGSARGVSATSVTAGLQQQGEGRAGGLGAPRDLGRDPSASTIG